MKLTDKLNDYASFEAISPCVTLSSNPTELEGSYCVIVGLNRMWVSEYMLFITLAEFLSYYYLGLLIYSTEGGKIRVDKCATYIKAVLDDN